MTDGFYSKAADARVDPDKAEPPERKQWVVLFGTPTDGFVIVGPFEAYGDADEYRTDLDGRENGWIMDLHAPAEIDSPP